MKKLIPVLIISSILLTSCWNTASKDSNNNTGVTSNTGVRNNNSNTGEIITSSGKEEINNISTGSEKLPPNELTTKNKLPTKKDETNSGKINTSSGADIKKSDKIEKEEEETLKEIDKILNDAMNEK